MVKSWLSWSSRNPFWFSGPQTRATLPALCYLAAWKTRLRRGWHHPGALGGCADRGENNRKSASPDRTVLMLFDKHLLICLILMPRMSPLDLWLAHPCNTLTCEMPWPFHVQFMSSCMLR